MKSREIDYEFWRIIDTEGLRATSVDRLKLGWATEDAIQLISDDGSGEVFNNQIATVAEIYQLDPDQMTYVLKRIMN